MKKISKTFLPVMVMLCLIINQANAQDEISSVKRWSADVSALSAAVFNISQGKLMYSLNPNSRLRSEIGIGYLFQPESNSKTNEGFNTDGIYSAKMATIAYRQFLWKGLHFEEDINFGQGAISDNVVDGKDYKEFVVLSQTYLGYKYDFCKRSKYNFFLMGQGGFGYAYNANHWPSNGSPTFFGMGDIKIGINF
jgi:hypothetical protein